MTEPTIEHGTKALLADESSLANDSTAVGALIEGTAMPLDMYADPIQADLNENPSDVVKTQSEPTLENRPVLPPIPLSRPTQLLMGYVPNATEKDAKLFVAGVAEKNIESPFITYIGLHKLGYGYAYEIHEGGHGLSYLEPLMAYYATIPATTNEKETAVYIQTAHRMIQIEKTADGGILGVQLPEFYDVAETEGIVPTKKLKLLYDVGAGYVIASGLFFCVMFMALLVSYFLRYQPYAAPPLPKQLHVTITDLPSQNWARVQYPRPGQYVTKWEYLKGKWAEPTLNSLTPEPATAANAHPVEAKANVMPVPALPKPKAAESPSAQTKPGTNQPSQGK